MRYHYEPPKFYRPRYATTYSCDHPVYSSCTLYEENAVGLAVIQQRYSPESKTTWWGPIDPWLVDQIYIRNGFRSYFKERAKEPVNGLYPTVSIRQLMWALRMKPIVKQRWETVFDRRLV